MTSRGRQSPIVQAQTITFGPDGVQQRIRFVGMKQAVSELLTNYANAGHTGQFSYDQSPHATLEVQLGSNVLPGGLPELEQPSILWKYFANTIEKDILELDAIVINTLSTAQKECLQVIITNGKKSVNATGSGPVTVTWTEDGTAKTATFTSAEHIELYTEIALNGLRARRVNVPTLSVEKLVSSFWNVKASLSYVDYVLTTATLQSQESIPSTVLFNLPDYTSARSDRAYGWYKNHPQVDQSGYNKWRISQTWEYGLWSTFAYGIPI